MEIYTKQEVMEHFIIMNVPRLQQIIQPYKDQRQAYLDKEDGIWHSDINNQFEKIIRSVIVADMCLNLPITTLDALVFIEEVDINQI